MRAIKAQMRCYRSLQIYPVFLSVNSDVDNDPFTQEY